jgi:hypothetical protein
MKIYKRWLGKYNVLIKNIIIYYKNKYSKFDFNFFLIEVK